jgi:hypothetical protein
VDRVTRSIHLADPRVDRHQLISITCYYITKIHTLSFLTFCLTCSVRDTMDPPNCAYPQSRVVSYLLSLFLCSSSQNRSFSGYAFRYGVRYNRALMVGSLPSSFIVSPQTPPSGASLRSVNWRVQVLLQLCSTAICGQIHRTYIYRET